MSWNRVQFKTMAREQADAENSPRWTDAYVDATFALTFDQGWRRVLNADPVYRYSKQTVTADSDGRVLFSVLDALITPDRRHRVLDRRQVRDQKLASMNEVVYEPMAQGAYLAFGTGATGQIPVWMSQLPQNPQTFTVNPDTAAVDWPDGFELVLVNHVAAMLLTKGGVEMGAASDLFAVVDALYTDMLQNLMRRTTKAPSFAPSDSANDWSAGMNW